jgi:nudix-type nucleoside diphosphatase (YffH/AdpP family)
MPGKAVIERQRRVFDDFFKVDELWVAHEQKDGSMSVAQRRLVFERGDSAAVLIFNAERECLVLVEQFKVPALLGRCRDDPATSDGWIIETVAGMVESNETPEASARRETLEETGYRIGRLQPIGRFFCSPGGTSERIFLYFAEVSDRDRIAGGGGIDDEDIRVLHLPVTEVFERLARGAIEDTKLALAACWLQQRMQRRGPAIAAGT